jgi:hypothetical protein
MGYKSFRFSFWMHSPTATVISPSVVNKVRAMLRARFPSVSDMMFNSDDAVAAFSLTERFYVRLCTKLGRGVVEFNDYSEPLDPLTCELSLRAGRLDADAMRDVVCAVYDITEERQQERFELQQIESVFS